MTPSTLFARSWNRDAQKRTGSFYTRRADILLIVEPILMQPLRQEWTATKAAIAELRPQWQAATGETQRELAQQIVDRFLGFRRKLGTIRVLDPACGAGNFLYVALECLLALQDEVDAYALAWNTPHDDHSEE